MKSIIQEASSIAKAVEEGWMKAQKPQEFSVKILEQAEKNFIGFTTKSAKIAIFFSEALPAKMPEKQRPHHKNTPPQQQSKPVVNKQQPTGTARPAQQQDKYLADKSKNNNVALQPTETSKKKQFEPLWNQAMVTRTEQWMRDALQNSNNEHIQFTVEPQKFHLRITLSAPILPDQDKEKQLLASFSALILETLKRLFKLSLRGHKIVLTHKPK